MSLYGLIIGISLVIGINYFLRQKTIPSKFENIFVFGTILSAIIGARAYHVIDEWTYYSQNLFQIPQTWNGGLGIFGALIAIAIFIFFFSLLSKIPFLKILDSITPILPLCQAIGRIGNFVNHEIPTWWLEASLNLVLFFILKSKALKSYSSTALYLIGYGIIRLVTEFWRQDTWVIGIIKIGQIISITFIFLGLLLIQCKKKRNPSKPSSETHFGALN